MLPARHRLRRRFEVEAVLKKGRRLRGQYLQCTIRERPRGGASRFTVIVSKKIDKRAVIRNRYKRFIRADLSALNFKAGYDVIMMVKQRTANNGHPPLTLELTKLLNDARLI